MIDDTGFHKRTYDEWVDYLIEEAQNTIAPDIATTPDSVLGTMIRLMAMECARQEEHQEQVFNSGFVSQANGVALDRLASNIGLTRTPSANAYVELLITGRPGTLITEGVRFATADGKQFFSIDNTELPKDPNDENAKVSEVTIKAVSVDKSDACNVGANKIVVFMESIDGLKTVTNPEPATGGADFESDYMMRKRLLLNYKKSANGTVNALIAAVENVTGVKMAQVIVNDTMTTDEYGNEPKSVHFYVWGGTDDAVADAIFNSVVAGVSTNGAIDVEVPVLGGNRTQLIKFDRPQAKEVSVKVVLKTNEEFGINDNDDVKAQLAVYLNGLTIGEPMYINRLIALCYQNKGVVDVSITATVDGEQLNALSYQPKQFEHVSAGEVIVTNG